MQFRPLFFGRSPGGEHGNPLRYSCLETEEPGELQSIGLQRVGHDWSNLASTHAPVTYQPLCWLLEMFQ